MKTHLPQRLVPDDGTLELAFRRALATTKVNKHLSRAVKEAVTESEEVSIPESLRRKVQSRMKKTGEPWDAALVQIAQELI